MNDRGNNNYYILKKIVGKSCLSSFDPNYSYMSNRFNAILEQINSDNIEIDIYDKEKRRANLYIYDRINYSKNTIVIHAHHDVVNPGYDNVADNTASVANVITLAKKFKNIKELPINVVFALTDGEELCSFHLAGSAFLAKHINTGKFSKVLETINLELTGHGKEIWVNGNGNLYNYEGLNKVLTPFSDTSVMLDNWIHSTCIGTFNKEDLESVRLSGSCKTWNLCHSINDKIENANEQNMVDFTNFIEKYISSNS